MAMTTDMKLPHNDMALVFDLAGVLVEWNMEALYSPMLNISGWGPDQLLNEVFGVAV